MGKYTIYTSHGTKIAQIFLHANQSRTSDGKYIHIVSLGGQLLRTLHLPAGETKVGGLSRGLYIVRLHNGTSQKVKL